ncbi:MAG: molybdopterin-dependent oxidoreductase [Sulfurovaceae bacterium]|nr:molybdopterin-dependent oxidoreductase [Sulfurovaceae bacterium]
MVKKMNQTTTSFFDSRRTFLKGSAYSIAAVGLAKGVFITIIDTPAMAETKFTSTPKALSFYPPLSQWDSFTELDGTDWKRGGIGRNGIASEGNPDGIKATEYMLVPAICSNCEAACGITGWVDIGTYKKTKDPRDLKVRKYMGNPLHPASRGRNCAKAYAIKSQMYDPDRIPFPLKRAPGSKRGEGKWVRTTWDEAMQTIGKKMHDTLQSGDEMSKKAIMYHVGRPNESGFGHRVLYTMGVDGHNSHSNVCSAGTRQGLTQWTGDDRPSPDWANSKLIFLQSSHAADAGHFFQQHAGFIADARRKGAKLVVMDPRMSNSAGMADLWVPIWPGTEAALYLYLVNRIVNEKDPKSGKDYIDHDFMKTWVNWDVLLKDKEYLNFIVSQGYISKLPAGESYEDFVKLLQEMYAPYTLDFAATECRVDSKTLEKLFDMFIEGGDKVTTYFWRAGTIGNRGGWMNVRAGVLALALRGCMTGDVGNNGFYGFHEIFVNAKGDAATEAGKKPGKVDAWNELLFPPDFPLATNEPSFLLPHLLDDEKWQDDWSKKGINVPKKLAVYIPRMYNPVWINPDGFRWIDVLKREDKIELLLNLSPTWSETNWYCDYILPTGLAGERHDEHSESTKPARWLAFRQPVLRVAMEKMGWKPKDPTRATLEAHTKAGLGEIWEEIEFWANIMVYHVDPDGSLGVKQHWASKEDPSRPVTIPEWYQAVFDNVHHLKEAASTNPKYANSKYPNYEMMRDMGTWLEQDNIFCPHKKELESKDGIIESMHVKFDANTISVEPNGVVKAKLADGDDVKPIGLKMGDKIVQGLNTSSGKFEFFSKWMTEWKWPEYAIPVYPTTKAQREKMVHIVSQIHHDHMVNDNDFALNPIFRYAYNVHTRSVNSKHLMEISQNHNPIWIATKDAERLGIKRGDAIKVTITDTVSGLESGYFVAMAVPTEAILPGTLACSHHSGRWKLQNAIDIPGFKEKLGVMGVGVPLYDMTMDGKIGTLKPKQGIKEGMMERKDSWQFKEFNKDLDNIWWDGLSGAWQNAVAPAHPDPIACNHAWHQKVSIEPAGAGQKIGDIYVNYDNNFKVYQAWRDTLARPLDSKDTTRRPKQLKRPVWPLTDNAKSVKITDQA